jgi:hypothetical protein
VTALSNTFSEFFTRKIHTTRTTLLEANQLSGSEMDALRSDVKFSGHNLDEFTAASCDEVNNCSKVHRLSPVNLILLKQCVYAFVPVIATIVNKSLCESVVPMDFKLAIVRPLFPREDPG